ncbi:MAG: ChrR family anti-sigma-E factor [Brevundimonas sp.]|uniref:cadmium/peroxide/UV radiation responsive anti-sigma factor ChrR n=1 Tax=Brevundimonas sp. TaxID=1871086 RepID=UPI0026205AC4|nr:ChrR family anti-sigma-E factor [Brevundimonas sp.]MDI6624925.1 ChrR family anti-sigma-E factor [Brevundimonas sp.]MDQ7811367.1 ChrR family anti-sigma-E factor [Brevundimonas sp.]
MTARLQPSEERLLAYAAGTLSPPESVVVATHLALRPETARWVDDLQAVGGEVLESLEPAAVADDLLARTLASLSAPEESVRPEPANDMTELPEPLRRYELGPWRWIGPDMHVRDVHAPRDGDCRVILLRIGSGRTTPVHTHAGVELTCVISGAYETDEARFGPGDFEEADGEVHHRPRTVSAEPCLCVVALDGQIRLDGWIGRLLQPLVRL